MTSSPNLVEIKQCLQEAGMYEENLNEDEMRSYYNVIKSSENTYKKEDEQRNTENSITADSTDDDALEIDDEETSPVQPTAAPNRDDAPEDRPILDPLDCSPMKHRLTIISHAPRYNVPPHIDPSLSGLSPKNKAKIISAFHRGLLQKFFKLHRKSKILAPWGSPIYPSETFKGWLDQKPNNSACDIETIEQDSVLKEETYTSRSGRQTKRKIYAEDVDSDSDKKRAKKINDEENYKPTAKRQSTFKLSNQDIMKRSKFFEDLQTSKSPKLSRFEAIAEQLTMGEKKRLQEEEKIESFKRSIPEAEEDNDTVVPQPQSTVVEDDDDFEEVKEVPLIRRRISPPLHGRRGIGPRKTGGGSLSAIDKLKPTENSQTPQRSVKPKSPHTSTSADIKQKNAKGMTKCPICSDFFHRDEVEAHASNCGLGMETPVIFETASPVNKSVKKLQCGICEEQMAMNTDYEIHVAECMRRERMK